MCRDFEVCPAIATGRGVELWWRGHSLLQTRALGDTTWANRPSKDVKSSKIRLRETFRVTGASRLQSFAARVRIQSQARQWSIRATPRRELAYDITSEAS
jgi:hypothetical protein